MKKDPRFQPVDATVTPRFAGIATFMRTQRHDISEDLDIALVGVPFDIGVNYRSGARQGPAAVREASRLIRRVHPTSGIAPYDICNVADVGDAPVNPLDFARSIAMIEAFFKRVHTAGAVPISIGGDHTVPLPILRAIAGNAPVGIVQIDSHADTLDTLADTKINHATTFRRGVEEGLIDPKRVIQIGLRGSRFSPDDIKWGEDQGFTCVTFDKYEDMGRARAIREIDRVTGQGPTYITIDIDGIDPAWAPGTGVPEIGGLSPRDAQVIVRSLQGKHLVGGDICEVAPCYDPTGITSVTAANLMWEMLCVIADSKARQET
ncbi:MAG: agmatinase [Hyphomicrobiales bacterium]